MASNEPASAFIDLPGSERSAHPNATLLGPANPEETATVLVMTSDRLALSRFAADHALTAEALDSSGFVRLAGRVGDLASAFQVELQAASLGDLTFRHRTGFVRIPAELADSVQAVLGLDTRPIARPYTRLHPLGLSPNAFTPPQVAKAYSFPPSTGAGQTVGIVELGGGYAPTDLQAAGVNPSNVTAIGTAGNQYSGSPNDATGEVSLDVQVIGAIATGVLQMVDFEPNTDAGFVQAILNLVKAKVCAISISWGSAEANWPPQSVSAMAAAFAQSVAAGIPVFAATGDNGSADGEASGTNVDYPASDRNVIGCAGTNLSGTAEVLWSKTGGGYSRLFPKPQWQPANVNNVRGVGDVCAVADPATGYVIHIGGGTFVFGGTSASAPLWAALVAVLSQSLGKPAGLVATLLYNLPATCFTPITQGSNGAYGPNPCAGRGRPIGTAILAALQAQQQPTPTPTPVPAPGPTVTVPGPIVGATRKTDTVHVFWKQPANTGGAPIDQYLVGAIHPGGNGWDFWKQFDPAITDAEVPASPYASAVYYVAAHNNPAGWNTPTPVAAS